MNGEFWASLREEKAGSSLPCCIHHLKAVQQKYDDLKKKNACKQYCFGFIAQHQDSGKKEEAAEK